VHLMDTTWRRSPQLCMRGSMSACAPAVFLMVECACIRTFVFVLMLVLDVCVCVRALVIARLF
jgi:hypothetical protein